MRHFHHPPINQNKLCHARPQNQRAQNQRVVRFAQQSQRKNKRQPVLVQETLPVAYSIKTANSRRHTTQNCQRILPTEDWPWLLKKSYLQSVKRSTNDRCRCGQSETTEHLILSCPETNNARRRLTNKLGGELSLQLLLHTKVGTEAMLEFLQETQIATREWHLGRNEELTEDEEGG